MFSVGYNPIEERVAELEEVTPNSDEGVLVNEDHQSNDGENEDDDHLDQDQPALRRSTRNISKPAYIDDYILVAEIECERLLLIINDEPWDFNEAKEFKVWVDACKEEIGVIELVNST